MHVKVSCAVEFSSDEILRKKNACEYEYEDRIFVFSERRTPSWRRIVGKLRAMIEKADRQGLAQVLFHG